MAAEELSIPDCLHQQERQQPDAPAFTFIDYELDANGYVETLTWAQISNRVRVLAAHIAQHGSPGDRVAIVAPQSLDYIVGFLAAMEAGFVAVPVSVPQFGHHDERFSAVLRDSAPVTVLTTSAVVDVVVPSVQAMGRSMPAIVEIDALDLDSPSSAPASSARHDVALLQYTSGSTRNPAGCGGDPPERHRQSSTRCSPITSKTPAGSSRPTSRWCRGCRSITTWV